MRRPKVLILGHSHTLAIQHALRNRASEDIEFEAYQFARPKNGAMIGDLKTEDALEMVSRLGSSDLLVSSIGGNQHSVVGLVQHPVPFDILESGEDESNLRQEAQCIPEAAMWDYIEAGIRRGDGELIKRLCDVAPCRVYHLCPPPPKEDATLILKSHETNFDKAGILEKGVSDARLRAKLWRLQCRILEKLCNEWHVRPLPPPGKAVTPEGYLKPEYYAPDATHANESYGALVLLRMAKIAAKTAEMRAGKVAADG